MQIKLEATLQTLKPRDFQRVVDKFIELELSQAVKAFLEACLARIPVQTGFLRGSFSSVSRFFKVKGVDFYGNNPRNRTYNGVIKSPTSGQRFVTPPEQVIRRTNDGGQINIENLITYFQENDTGSKIPSAPWGATEAGIDAANERLATALSRFPKLEAFLSTVSVNTSGTSFRKSTQEASVEEIITQMELLIER